MYRTALSKLLTPSIATRSRRVFSHAPSAVLDSYTAPAPCPIKKPVIHATPSPKVEARFAAYLRDILPREPAPDFCKVMPQFMHERVKKLIWITDPTGEKSHRFYDDIIAKGYVEFFKQNPGPIWDTTPLHMMPVLLDFLLYIGRINDAQWQTGYTMFAFWRSSRGAPCPPEQSIELDAAGIPTGRIMPQGAWIDMNQSTSKRLSDLPHCPPSEEFVYQLVLHQNSCIPPGQIHSYERSKFLTSEVSTSRIALNVPSTTQLRRNDTLLSNRSYVSLQPRLGLETDIRAASRRCERPLGNKHPFMHYLQPGANLDIVDGFYVGESPHAHDLDHAYFQVNMPYQTRRLLLDVYDHLKSWFDARYNQGELGHFDTSIPLPKGVSGYPDLKKLIHSHLEYLLDQGYAPTSLISPVEMFAQVLLKCLNCSLFDLYGQPDSVIGANFRENFGAIFSPNVLYVNKQHWHPEDESFVTSGNINNQLLAHSRIASTVDATQFLAEANRVFNQAMQAAFTEAVRWLVQVKKRDLDKMFTHRLIQGCAENFSYGIRPSKALLALQIHQEVQALRQHFVPGSIPAPLQLAQRQVGLGAFALTIPQQFDSVYATNTNEQIGSAPLARQKWEFYAGTTLSSTVAKRDMPQTENIKPLWIPCIDTSLTDLRGVLRMPSPFFKSSDKKA